MNVHLNRVGAVHYAASAGNHTVHMDGAEKFGGRDAGMRPMELFLSALASCSAMDVTEILEEAGRHVESLEVDISGERAKTAPAYFTDIEVIYTAKGSMSPEELHSACESALEERCSVREMIRGNVNVTFKTVLEK